MRAIVVDRHGGPEVLRSADLPRPSPGRGQARVRVRACALNHLDVWVRMGLPGLALSYPHVLGSDIAGEVDDPGDSGWRTGQPVLVAPGFGCGACADCLRGDDHLCDAYDILGQRSNGGYAEFAVVPAANLFPLPAGMTFEQAASLPLVFLTAWQMLIVNGALREGQSVLVHAGGSGVGIASIQIAKAHGARVLTTVGRAEKIEPARALGADVVINYRESDFAERVKSETSGRGVDLAVEHIGAETFERTLSCVAKGGRLLTCGATSGRRVEFDLRSLFGRNITIRGSRMGRRDGLAKVLKLADDGKVRPVIDRVYPLSDAAEAHRRLEARDNFGKIVLTV